MLSVLNQRSNTHNSCEDSVYVCENQDVIYGVVADGCSTGIKSHFASQALCYAVANNSGLQVTGDYTIMCIMRDLRRVANLFNLSAMNMLSTAMFFVYFKKDKRLKVRVFGDGFYFVNNVEFCIDQNNEPDYIGYHLWDEGAELNDFLSKYKEEVYEDVDSFHICSDGIMAIDRTPLHVEPKHLPGILMHPPMSANYLTRMWNLLKRDHYTLGDDLTIVSYATSNNESSTNKG